MESIGAGIVLELFKKVLNLFGDSLWDKLKDKKLKARDSLVNLSRHLKELEQSIEQILGVFDLLIADDENFHEADHQLAASLRETKKIMINIASDLKPISHEFEIMAEETAPLISDYWDCDMLFIDTLGLLRNYDYQTRDEESLQDYKERLLSIKTQGLEARKSLNEFIRNSYTWDKLNE